VHSAMILLLCECDAVSSAQSNATTPSRGEASTHLESESL